MKCCEVIQFLYHNVNYQSCEKVAYRIKKIMPAKYLIEKKNLENSKISGN